MVSLLVFNAFVFLPEFCSTCCQMRWLKRRAKDDWDGQPDPTDWQIQIVQDIIAQYYTTQNSVEKLALWYSTS